MPNTDKLLALLDKLISDGRALIKSAIPSRYGREIADEDGLKKWSNELILFKSIAGDLVKPWSGRLVHDGNVVVPSHIEHPVSSLETIRYAMQNGLLAQFEDLVIADAFADLNEQGNYLLDQNYFLAAGVIYRAVLEEKLRKLTQRHNCIPAKQKPTINDFNQALYTTQPPVYDKNMQALGMMPLTINRD